MATPIKSLVITISLLTFIILVSIPNMAQAQAGPASTANCAGNTANGIDNSGQGTMGPWQQTYVNNIGSAAQSQSQAAMLGIASVPPIDVQLDYCLDKLVNMFTQIAQFSDPLNVVGGILIQYMTQFMTQLSGACNKVVGAMSGIEKSALSQLDFCMPIPALKLNLNVGGYNAQTKPCNGTQILGLQMTPINQLNQSQIGTPSLYRLMIPQQQ